MIAACFSGLSYLFGAEPKLTFYTSEENRIYAVNKTKGKEAFHIFTPF
jgi:hypothetical protein